MTGDKQQRTKGFTLVEMMVAITVFATASVIISDLFLSFNRSQRRAQASQAVQSDARVLLANIVDKIRSGEINYSVYTPNVSNPETELHLVGNDGTEFVIRRSDSDFVNTVCPSAIATPCLEISDDGGSTFSPMTSERLRVVGVQFYISPIESPTVQSGPGVFTYNVQPRVTVVLGFQGTSTQAAEQGTAFVQTTVSSRVLLR